MLLHTLGGYATHMADLDVAPATVRGPLTTTRSGVVTFARVIVHDGRLFVAEGSKRGAIVSSVTEYPAPEGEPERNPRKSKGFTWGEWSWDSCGCSSSWGKHSRDALLGMAVTLPEVEDEPDAELEPDDNPDVDAALPDVREA